MHIQQYHVIIYYCLYALIYSPLIPPIIPPYPLSRYVVLSCSGQTVLVRYCYMTCAAIKSFFCLEPRSQENDSRISRNRKPEINRGG